MAADALSAEDQEFLASCEEELIERYTENDDDFMNVFNSEPSKPPVLSSWWVSNSGRRNDNRHNRRFNPYERHGRDRDQGYQDRRGNRGYRGYDDYNRGNDDRAQGYRPQRRRY